MFLKSLVKKGTEIQLEWQFYSSLPFALRSFPQLSNALSNLYATEEAYHANYLEHLGSKNFVEIMQNLMTTLGRNITP